MTMSARRYYGKNSRCPFCRRPMTSGSSACRRCWLKGKGARPQRGMTLGQALLLARAEMARTGKPSATIMGVTFSAKSKQ